MFLPAPPSVFQKHNKQLLSHQGSRHLQMLSRSALGLVDVCNLLPQYVVEQKSVAAMQHELQMLLKFRAANGDDKCLSHLLATRPSVRAPVAYFFLETPTCVVSCCRPPVTAGRVRLTRRKKEETIQTLVGKYQGRARLCMEKEICRTMNIMMGWNSSSVTMAWNSS